MPATHFKEFGTWATTKWIMGDSIMADYERGILQGSVAHKSISQESGDFTSITHKIIQRF